MKLKDVMNRVVTIEEDVKLIEVAKIFSREGISSLVLIKGGNARGIITERDVIKNVEHLKTKKVSQVMSRKLITIEYDGTIEEAAELMHKKKIKRVLVIDEQDNLVGIITATDVIANADLLNKAFSLFD